MESSSVTVSRVGAYPEAAAVEMVLAAAQGMRAS
jgi:hypothetical protein